MKLKPMDITNKEFKRAMRGYNLEEVDDFLDEIAEDYEELFKNNAKLEVKLEAAAEQIKHYSDIETTIQNTLLLAQNAADQVKETAQKEADLIMKNANEAAKKIIDRANNDVISITDEYEKIRQDYIKFKVKFRNFMQTQLETFEDLEKELSKSYSIATPVEEKAEEEVFNLGDEDVKPIDIDLNIGDEEIKSFFATSDENNIK